MKKKSFNFSFFNLIGQQPDFATAFAELADLRQSFASSAADQLGTGL